jgi:rhodanese-related sulfurtransferase
VECLYSYLFNTFYFTYCSISESFFLLDYRSTILDVRDPEEILSTGYIRSSKNVTHVSFEDDDDADEQVKSLLAMAEGTNNPAFVFHCAYSQQRGPFAASRFLSRCSVQDKQPTVLILQGGFDSWKRLSLENELVSNFTMPPQ